MQKTICGYGLFQQSVSDRVPAQKIWRKPLLETSRAAQREILSKSEIAVEHALKALDSFSTYCAMTAISEMFASSASYSFNIEMVRGHQEVLVKSCYQVKTSMQEVLFLRAIEERDKTRRKKKP